jgi:DNA-binding NarL/FixJ family response regulator
MTTVLVIDDSCAFRESLAQLLAAVAEAHVVTVPSADEGLAWLERNRADVVLVDVRLGEADGLQLTRRILQLPERLRVVVMTAYGEEHYATEAEQLGAHAFVRKTDGLAAIIAAVFGPAAASYVLASDRLPSSEREPERQP